jgi:chromosome partitioning protein
LEQGLGTDDVVADGSFRVRDTAEGLKVLGMLANTSIVLRNDHQDAVGTGMGVTEIAPAGAAADEIRKLWGLGI